MGRLPRIGARVRLRDADGRVYSTRIEDAGGTMLAVARPSDLLAAVEYAEGLELELVWEEPSGVHVLPVALAGTAVDHHIRLWDLEILGDAWVEQRREYVRIPAAGVIRLTAEPPSDQHDAPGGTATVDGALIDLSEVATQCALQVDPEDPRVDLGTRVRCRFDFTEESFDIPGEIVIRRRGTTAHEVRAVIRFDDDQRTSAVLRKAIFTAQIEMRRSRTR